MDLNTVEVVSTRTADLPMTEVYFADTYDELGPLGAKSMSESPYNPVAPALANAIARACGPVCIGCR
jgi:CO/xanthine dehydrogenase Mo-binding subunit